MALTWRTISKRKMTPLQRAKLKQYYLHWQTVGVEVEKVRWLPDGKLVATVRVKV